MFPAEPDLQKQVPPGPGKEFLRGVQVVILIATFVSTISIPSCIVLVRLHCELNVAIRILNAPTNFVPTTDPVYNFMTLSSMHILWSLS